MPISLAIRFQQPVAEPAVLATHRALTGVRRSAHLSPSRFAELVTAIEKDTKPALAAIPGDVSLELGTTVNIRLRHEVRGGAAVRSSRRGVDAQKRSASAVSLAT